MKFFAFCKCNNVITMNYSFAAPLSWDLVGVNTAVLQNCTLLYLPVYKWLSVNVYMRSYQCRHWLAFCCTNILWYAGVKNCVVKSNTISNSKAIIGRQTKEKHWQPPWKHHVQIQQKKKKRKSQTQGEFLPHTETYLARQLMITNTIADMNHNKSP